MNIRAADAAFMAILHSKKQKNYNRDSFSTPYTGT